MSQLNLRAHAAKVLTSVVKGQQSLASLFPYQQANFSEQDEALLQELCFGVCRWYPRLQTIAQELLDKPLKAKDQDIHCLLLLGFYQLEYTRIPAHAAISETVQACKQLKKASLSGLVNAILRRGQRERDRLQEKLGQTNAYLYAHPAWLLKRFQQAWPTEWRQICAANNQRAPMTLRINRLQQDRQAYLNELARAGLEARAGTYSPAALTLDRPVAVQRLPDFAKGACSVQDEAAQLAAGLLQLEPGQHVLDACAAPGGKTCHLLEKEPQLASLTALELDAGRAEKIFQNLQRLKLEAQVIIGDASKPADWWNRQPYDRILLDAPCSATGVIRRHPDIKLLRHDEDIAALSALQLQILSALWPTLKPHGILIYATCSVLPEENEQLIGRFLAQQKDAIHLAIDADWGVERPCGRQLFPQPQGHDGFYYARIQKHS